MSLPVLALVVALQQPIAIEHVTVIDGTGAPPRANLTVITRGDRIVSITPSAQARVPAGARRVDGRGSFLLPGFVDAHAHVAFGAVSIDSTSAGPAMRMEYDHDASREMLGTLLAFGVTAVRNPAGPLPQAVAVRDSVERGLLLGPRIRTAGEVIDATPAKGLAVGVRTEEEMREEVDRQAAAGVDYIKLYAGLRAPLVVAGIDQAHRRGLRALAHLWFTSWTDAANARIDGIVHVVPGSPQLLPAERRAAYLETITGTQFMATWFRFVDLSSPEIRTMTEALVQHGVVLDLTLVAFEAMFRGNDSAIVADRALAYAPPALVENWQAGSTLSRGWSDADFDAAQAIWPTVLSVARHLHERGVKLVVGTDTPNPWVAPGTSFHREMRLYVDAGIPTADVLRMATLGGAEALGLELEIGTVAVGKRADLVLLGADPLERIDNTRRIALVILGGKPFLPSELIPARLRAVRDSGHAAFDSALRRRGDAGAAERH
jgi:imidazolonepropionase-like amidohydrolase